MPAITRSKLVPLADHYRQLMAGLKPGRVYTVKVWHELHCSELSWTGPCDCQPIVEPPREAPDPELN
jgi:hypothetical protein